MGNAWKSSRHVYQKAFRAGELGPIRPPSFRNLGGRPRRRLHYFRDLAAYGIQLEPEPPYLNRTIQNGPISSPASASVSTASSPSACSNSRSDPVSSRSNSPKHSSRSSRKRPAASCFSPTGSPGIGVGCRCGSAPRSRRRHRRVGLPRLGAHRPRQDRRRRQHRQQPHRQRQPMPGFANLFITCCASSASNWPATKGRSFTSVISVGRFPGAVLHGKVVRLHCRSERKIGSQEMRS